MELLHIEMADRKDSLSVELPMIILIATTPPQGWGKRKCGFVVDEPIPVYVTVEQRTVLQALAHIIRGEGQNREGTLTAVFHVPNRMTRVWTRDYCNETERTASISVFAKTMQYYSNLWWGEGTEE